MRIGLAISLCLCLIGGAAQAQDSQAEEDRGLLQGLIEDNLSGAGREVRITGFKGALSSQATLESLTIADDDGIWLTLTNVALDWSRAALLRGQLSVESLTAEEISLPRLPAPSGVSTKDAEAQPFKLPELPVSVKIGRIEAQKVELGAPVLGQALELSVAGAVNLADGAGSAQLAVTRRDAQGEIALDAAFENQTEQLSIDLSVQEGRSGIISGLIGLPDEPAIALTVKGEAPLSDFVAQIRLASDGQDRLAGTVSLGAQGTPETGVIRLFSVDLGGDLAPLFAPDLREFFGPDVRLVMSGRSQPDGRVDISDLSVSASELVLAGNLSLDAGGLPTKFDLNGEISGAGAVRLPLAGPATLIDGATLVARFDAALGDRWTADIDVRGLKRGATALDAAKVSGGGTIRAQAPRGVTAMIDFNADGIALEDAALAKALGAALEGSAALSWDQGSVLTLSSLDVSGAGLQLTAQGTLDGLGSGFPTQGQVRIEAADLSRFSGLAGRDVAGSAEISLTGSGALLGGAFDVQVSALTTDLVTDTPQIDPLLRGQSRLNVDAARGTDGTVLRRFDIRNAAVTANASGQLNSRAGNLALVADLADAALVEPRLPSGAISLDTAVNWQEGAPLTLSHLSLQGQGLDVTAAGTVGLEDDALPVSGRLQMRADDLSRLSELAGRSLVGAIEELTVTGNGAARGQSFDLTITAVTRNIVTDTAWLDPLLKGQTRLNASGAVDGSSYLLRSFDIDNPQITAIASGRMADGDGALDLNARVQDLALIDPALSGPATLETTASQQDDAPWSVSELRLTGAGVQADGTGTFDPSDPAHPVTAAANISVADLSVFSGLAGRTLAGRLSARINGDAAIKGQAFDVTVDATGQGLRAGLGDLDALIGGESRLSLVAARQEGGLVVVRQLDVATAQMSAKVDGGVGDGETLTFDARLANLGVLVPDFPGPLTARGTARQQGENWQLALNATGPGGVTGDVSGTVAADGASVDLAAKGTAPLALANSFIAPRSVQGTARYDLRIKGKPGLDAVSGNVAIADGRLSAPTLTAALNKISGQIGLSGGRAQIDLAGRVYAGGGITVSGPIGLSAPYQADLAVVLDRAILRDPSLYETRVYGRVALSGPLTGAGQISGQLSLGETDIQVPSTGLGVGSIPDGLEHVAMPADVRRTLVRAGVDSNGKNSAADSGPGLGLNLTIDAPNRMFIRGRGLEAELGGRLQLTGTTNNVVPIGQFNLVRGRLDILGQRLNLTEGSVRLQGAFDPYLRLVAETQADDVNVQVVVEGEATAPSISFLSQPELPEDEVLSRLLFGRGVTSLSPLQAAQLASAVATLAGRGGAGLIGKLRQGTGLDDLDVTTSDEGTTALRAGKYLSENIYTDVTVDSSSETEINLNLDVSRSVTVKGTLGAKGDTSIGIFVEKDY